ncbi:MAG: hypothetical protein FWC34_02100 [Bacteroidetes bacterium]|nr:hypothetical protein [Bacteroidota bacterium]MCL2303199.1 hypothetical protein [Lentimicrobiaceae bacterium]
MKHYLHYNRIDHRDNRTFIHRSRREQSYLSSTLSVLYKDVTRSTPASVGGTQRFGMPATQAAI